VNDRGVKSARHRRGRGEEGLSGRQSRMWGDHPHMGISELELGSARLKPSLLGPGDAGALFTPRSVHDPSAERRTEISARQEWPRPPSGRWSGPQGCVDAGEAEAGRAARKRSAHRPRIASEARSPAGT